MIKIDEGTVEIQYSVDTPIKKIMCEISQLSFEKACITADVKALAKAIDKKYGKATALKMFTLVISDIYTSEDIEQVQKELYENE